MVFKKICPEYLLFQRKSVFLQREKMFLEYVGEGEYY